MWVCVIKVCIAVGMKRVHDLNNFLYSTLYLIIIFSLCCSYKWEAIDRDNKVSYTIKLCESSPTTNCGPRTSVCAQDLNTKTDRSVGEYGPLVRTGTQ